MTRVFSVKLLERVLRVFVAAFAGVYAAPSVLPLVQRLSDLSIAHKAAAAGLAAVIELVVGLVGAQVGNPNSPSILPKRLLAKIGGAKVPVDVQTVVDTVAQLGSTGPVTVEQLVVELAKRYGVPLPKVALSPATVAVPATATVTEVPAPTA